ncbi:MAG: hypothetical protein K1X74_14350 [Pirellulales bacterium]|nr:hypothetical protein [Pirellulales bacterium]
MREEAGPVEAGPVARPGGASSGRAWWLVAAAVPLILCAGKLELDLWHDEIHTIVFYASRPAAEIVRDYSAPNNHVLYTLCLAPWTRVSLVEPWLRVPSLACAVATLVLVYRLGLRVAGRAAALLATSLLGLTLMFLVHVMQVRGYGLSMALVAALALLAVGAPDSSRLRRVLVVLLAAAAVYTIPTNALFVAALGAAAGALVLSRAGWRSAASAAAVWGGGLALGLACYAPVWQQLLEHSRDAPSAKPEAVLRLAGRFFWAAGHDSWPLAICAALLLPWWLRPLRRRPSEIGAYLGLAAAVLLPWAACMVARTTPFERNFTPLLPVLAVLVAAPLSGLAGFVERRWPRAASTVVPVVAVAVPLVLLLPAVWLYPSRLAAACRRGFAQDGYYNYYAANYRPRDVVTALAGELAGAQADRDYAIYFTDEDQTNLVYYLNRAGVPEQRVATPAALPRLFAIVSPRPDHAQWSARFHLDRGTLDRMWLIRDTGYYRLLSTGAPTRAP